MSNQAGNNPILKASLAEVKDRAPLGVMILTPSEAVGFLLATFACALGQWHEPFVVNPGLHDNNLSTVRW
jgi:hypothetical protein